MPIETDQLWNLAKHNQQQQPDATTIKILKTHNIWRSTPHDKLTANRIRRQYRSRQHKNNHVRRTDKLPTIINVNARSLTLDTRDIGSRNNTSKVAILNQILLDGAIDIACITETWLNDTKKSLIISSLDNNYHIISNERTDRTGGGTMIMLNKNYSNNFEHVQTTKTNTNSNAEITLVKLRPKRLPRGYASCIVATVYHQTTQ